jgi:hypothetical protein
MGRPAGVALHVDDRQNSAVTDQPTMRVPSTRRSADDTLAPRGRGKIFALPRGRELAQLLGLLALTALETGLLTISLIPASRTASLGWSATNGPFPASSAFLVTAIFYLAPFATGLLTRRWEVALFAATFPAWFSIGLFSVASSPDQGIFSFAHGEQPGYLVGTLELFAALGGFGWLMRRVITGRDAA